jgi:hypothetical protein
MAGGAKNRKPAGSLIIAVICIGIAVALLLFSPSSPINSTHANQIVTPGAISLPPTAVPSTATIGQ